MITTVFEQKDAVEQANNARLFTKDKACKVKRRRIELPDLVGIWKMVHDIRGREHVCDLESSCSQGGT